MHCFQMADHHVRLLLPVWQGVSQAGYELGLDDPRSSLLTHCFRIFDTLANPTFLLLENVGNLRSKALSEVFAFVVKAGAFSSSYAVLD